MLPFRRHDRRGRIAIFLPGAAAYAQPPDACALLAPELPVLLGQGNDPPQTPIGPTSCFVRNPQTGASVTVMSHGKGTGKPQYLAGVRAGHADSDN